MVMVKIIATFEVPEDVANILKELVYGEASNIIWKTNQQSEKRDLGKKKKTKFYLPGGKSIAIMVVQEMRRNKKMARDEIESLVRKYPFSPTMTSNVISKLTNSGVMSTEDGVTYRLLEGITDEKAKTLISNYTNRTRKKQSRN